MEKIGKYQVIRKLGGGAIKEIAPSVKKKKRPGIIVEVAPPLKKKPRPEVAPAKRKK